MRRISRVLGSKTEGLVISYQTIESNSKNSFSGFKYENVLRNRNLIRFQSILIIMYTILVIIRISFELETRVYTDELDILELVFLSFFVLEVLLRISTYRLLYFKSIWNLFDMVIITVCLIIIINSFADNSLIKKQAFGLGKVLRIFRLFLMFRKIHAIREHKGKTIRKSTVFSMTTPSEKVLKILSSLLDMDWIAYHSSLKADIEWCIYMIKEQKIYQTNIHAEKEELMDFVNWAADEQLEDLEQEIPIKTDANMHITLYEKYSTEIENLLSNSHKWDFDIFNFEKITENRSLEIMTNHLLSLYNLYQTLTFNSTKFMSFIKEIQNGYHKDNFYHNSTHAADVVQSFYYMLNTCQGIDICQLSDFDIGICIISAAIHDYDHPGVNNIFLINTCHSLAIMYNDNSVLENFHVASAFKVLGEENKNFMEDVQKENRKKFRMKCIGLVLATDFARHFADFGKFQLRFSNGGVKDEEDRLMVMEMMMHASDIGNPSRPWKLCYEWANKVMNEFFAQGDREREMGLRISNLCDRNSVSIQKAQIGFIELFIEPTFNMLGLVLPNANENVKYAIENKQHWKETMDNNNDN